MQNMSGEIATTWVHYTTRTGQFILDPTFRDQNADEPGLFVYSLDDEQPWPGRRRVEIDAPADVAVLIQSFDDGELRGPHGEPLPGFREWLIPAREYARCTVHDYDYEEGDDD